MAGRLVTLVLCGRTGAVLGALPPFEVEVPWWPEALPIVERARELYGLDVTVLRVLGGERDAPGPSGGSVAYLAEVDGEPEGLRASTGDPTGRRAAASLLGAPGRARSRCRLGGRRARRARHSTHRRRAAGAHVESVEPLAAAARDGRRVAQGGAAVLRSRGAHARTARPRPRATAHRGGGSARPPGRDPRRGPVRRDGDAAAPDGGDAGRAPGTVVGPRRGASRARSPRLGGCRHWRQPLPRSWRATPASSTPRSSAECERLVSSIPARTAEIADCGLPDTLVHGDFHRGNVRGSDGRLVLLDWGDCGVGHPLLDQTAFLDVCRTRTELRCAPSGLGCGGRSSPAAIPNAPRRCSARGRAASGRGRTGRSSTGSNPTSACTTRTTRRSWLERAAQLSAAAPS